MSKHDWFYVPPTNSGFNRDYKVNNRDGGGLTPPVNELAYGDIPVYNKDFIRRLGTIDIESLRRNRGISISKLAYMVDIEQGNLSWMLAGKLKISEAQYEEILIALGVNPSMLNY